MGNAADSEIPGARAFVSYPERGKADAGNSGETKEGRLKAGGAGSMSSNGQDCKYARREIPEARTVHRNENPGEQANRHAKRMDEAAGSGGIFLHGVLLNGSGKEYHIEICAFQKVGKHVC